MRHTLIIMFAPDTDSSDMDVDWVLQDADERVVSSGQAALDSLAGQVEGICDDYSVVALVPSERVLLTRVEIPSTQLRQIRQALPFMVEELIADDIDTIHTAIPTQFRDSLPKVDTAIVEHKQLVAWLDLLHSNGLSPSALLVDVLCLPYENNPYANKGWTIVVDRDRLLARDGVNQGMVIQRDDAELMLQSLHAKHIASRNGNPVDNAITPHIQIISSQANPGDGEFAEQLCDFVKMQCPEYTANTAVYQEPIAELVSQDWHGQFSEGINLLQGGYGIGKRDRNTPFPWGMAASVAAIGIALYLLTTVLGGWYFNMRADQLESRSVALYQDMFPAERRVVNPRRQMENHLRQQGALGGSTFLALLADTAKQMETGAAAEGVSVRQIRYNNEQGDLRFELSSHSLEQLDQFKTQLMEGGLRVDINSASEQGEGVLGRIVVRAL